jgi:hypothetical protein
MIFSLNALLRHISSKWDSATKQDYSAEEAKLRES